MLEQFRNTPLVSQTWRLLNLYTIRDADANLVKFNPNLAQRRFWNRYHLCNHVLKARKLGFSTFLEVYAADCLIFGSKPLTSGIIDYTIDDAESKLEMLATAWQHLDNGDLHPTTWRLGALVKRLVPMVSQAKRRIEFGNGAVAKCSTSLRGATPNIIHVSELGKTAIWAPKKAKEIINGAFNSITPGNVRNIETTHEGGKAGENFRLLQQCMRFDDANLSPIQSRFHFFPWHLDPRYVLPFRGKLRPETVRYFQQLAKDNRIQVTREQAQWYDDKSLEQGHGMRKEFPSTPGEAFEAISEGAIYGEQMANLRAAGRICDFWLEARLPIYTFADLGLSDYLSFWLIQPVGRFFLVLDWMELEGVPATAVPDLMRRWESKWRKPIAMHFLPHDGDRRSPTDAKSYVQVLKEGGMHNIKTVPRIPDKWLGIGYVRDVLPHCWFHKTFTDTPRNKDGSPHDDDDTQESFPSGVACLEGYHRETSPSGASLKLMPKHDLFSHSCDAFRTFAEAHHAGMINDDHRTEGKPFATGGPVATR